MFFFQVSSNSAVPAHQLGCSLGRDEEGAPSREGWVLLCNCIVLHGSMWYWSVLVKQGLISLGSSAGKCLFGIVATRVWAVKPSSGAWTELVVKVDIICHS